MSKISVIVPVYKVEQYLDRCVESILAQSFTDFELILVDDGSPDRCPEICDEYAKKDKRIKVIHKENGGLSDARNAGLDYVFENSDSEWVSFVDSDDWIHPKTLESLYKAANELSVNVSVTDYKKVTALEKFDDYDTISAKLMDSEDYYITSKSSMVAWAKLYKKDCFKTIRYPVGKIHEDEFVTYKIIYAQPNIAVVDKPLYYYYTNPNGIMNSQWNSHRLDALEAYAERIAFFEGKQYDRALKKTVQVVLNYLVENYKIVDSLLRESYDKENKIIKRKLKKQLRFYVKKYKKVSGLSLKTHAYIYEVMHPVLMRFYWRYLVFINRFKNPDYNV